LIGDEERKRSSRYATAQKAQISEKMGVPLHVQVSGEDDGVAIPSYEGRGNHEVAETGVLSVWFEIQVKVLRGCPRIG
jgi:hypothetical protein